MRTPKRAAELAEAGKETLAEFAAEWWEQYAIGNLAQHAQGLRRLVEPRRALAPWRLPLERSQPQVIVGFRTELEAAGVGPNTAHEPIRAS